MEKHNVESWENKILGSSFFKGAFRDSLYRHMRKEKREGHCEEAWPHDDLLKTLYKISRYSITPD